MGEVRGPPGRNESTDSGREQRLLPRRGRRITRRRETETRAASQMHLAERQVRSGASLSQSSARATTITCVGTSA
jgi:hypothetical protein